MPAYSWKDDAGKTYRITSDAKLTDAELSEAVGGKTSAPAKPKEYVDQPVRGAIADTLGLSSREGAVPLTGAPGTKTPLGVVLKPEGAMERIASGAVTVPSIFAGGAGAGAVGAPAWLGRVAASGGLAKARGESNYTAGLEALAAGVAEGGLGLVGKLAGKSATALERVREIIGRGQGGANNLGVLASKIQNWLSATTKTERDVFLRGTPAGTAPGNTAVEGIIPFLEKIDPRAAKVFAEEVAQGLKLPKGLRLPALGEGASKGVRDVAGSAATRSIADAAVSDNRTGAGLFTEAPASAIGHLFSTPGRLIHMLGR